MTMKALTTFFLGAGIIPPLAALIGYFANMPLLLNWGVGNDIAMPTAVSLVAYGIALCLLMISKADAAK